MMADSVFFGLPVRSITTDNEATIYKLFPHAPGGRFATPGRIKKLPYSPIGQYVTVSEGIWTFDTVKNSKPLLVLNCRAKLNESWTFADGTHQVELVKIDVQNSDSVLTFSLDGKADIKVSGKHGLLSFPNLLSGDTKYHAQKTSVKTPTHRSLRDYENGTVIVTTRDLGFGTSYFNYYIDSFYNRQVSSDSSKITFNIFRERIYQGINARDPNHPVVETFYESDTSQTSFDFSNTPILNRVPEALVYKPHPFKMPDSVFVTAQMRWSSHFEALIIKERTEDIYQYHKGRDDYFIDTWNGWDYQYVNGIGRQYSSCPESESCSSTEIVYFKNSEKEIGEYPEIVVGVNPKGLDHKTLKCYPNPVSTQGTVTIELSSEKGSTITWYTIDGQEIRTKEVSGIGQLNLDVDMAPGTYLLEVSNDESKSVQQVVVTP